MNSQDQANLVRNSKLRQIWSKMRAPGARRRMRQWRQSLRRRMRQWRQTRRMRQWCQNPRRRMRQRRQADPCPGKSMPSRLGLVTIGESPVLVIGRNAHIATRLSSSQKTSTNTVGRSIPRSGEYLKSQKWTNRSHVQYVRSPLRRGTRETTM